MAARHASKARSSLPPAPRRQHQGIVGVEREPREQRWRAKAKRNWDRLSPNERQQREAEIAHVGLIGSALAKLRRAPKGG